MIEQKKLRSENSEITIPGKVENNITRMKNCGKENRDVHGIDIHSLSTIISFCYINQLCSPMIPSHLKYTSKYEIKLESMIAMVDRCRL